MKHAGFKPASSLAAVGLLAVAMPAVQARVLTAGEGGDYPGLAAAVRAAADGDTIRLAPGQYYECAVTGQRNLTIEGDGDRVVLTDRTCQGKALLVLTGDHATIRNLTLARARVPDGNGAGIRLEAPSVTVQKVTFDNDEVGLLAAADGGEIVIEDSIFRGGGVGGDRPLFAVMVPSPALLRITGSTFTGVAGGQVSTTASRTELLRDQIGTGAGQGPAPAVWAAGGALLAESDTFTIGPSVPNRSAAIVLLDNATATLRGNRLVNQTGQAMTLLLDWSWGSPVLADNTLAASDTLVDDSGITRHRLSDAAHAMKDDLRSAAGSLKRLIKSLL